MHMQEDLNPFWATVGLEIEPAGRGEGLRYISNVSVGSLPKSFQKAKLYIVKMQLKKQLLRQVNKDYLDGRLQM